jgi:hypothetical protein
MRYLLAPLCLTSLLVATGCLEWRQDWTAAPDRAGHAYVVPINTGTSSKTADPNSEQYYSATGKDTLTSVSKKFGVKLNWLIERNDLHKSANIAGMNLIVPKMTTRPPGK